MPVTVDALVGVHVPSTHELDGMATYAADLDIGVPGR
jgi:hypothetical protein